MKKILFLFFGMLFFLPVSNALAFNGGYFDTEHGETIDSRLIDNSVKTGVVIGASKTINVVIFNTPKDIEKISFYDGTSPFIKYHFYNNEGRLVYTYPSNTIPDPPGSYKTVSNLDGIKRISAQNTISGGIYQLYEMDVILKRPLIVTNPVTDLKEENTHNSVTLKWTNPTGLEFIGTTIKKNGVVLTELSKSVNSYAINGLDPETAYKFEVVAKYSGDNYSPGTTIDVMTGKEPIKPPAPPEVTNLNLKATHERVDLNWALPKGDDFKHVNIYRDTIKKTALIDKLIGTETVYAAETKIFETNGTYFNDLTVVPSTTYEYTLTTTSIKLIESTGITKQITTSVKPKTPIVGGGYEEDEETRDFTYSWTSPTTGQVKIIVGGVSYKIVSASDLKIVIPKASMKFNILGAPDVELIPIDEDGTEGSPTAPPPMGGIGGGGIPFTPNDLLKSGMGLLWIVGPFVLLALAFLLVPKLRNMIVQAFNQKKGQQTTTGRRFSS